MVKVHVTQHIAGSLNEVFDYVSNHEEFLGRYPGMHARIVAPGSPERDGLGCVREVFVGKKIRYLEQVTEWSRPSSFEDMIREASMPIRHYGSRLEFIGSCGGTDITWTSHYDVPVPLIGWVIGLYMKIQYQAAFRELLENANRAFDRNKTVMHDKNA